MSLRPHVPTRLAVILGLLLVVALAGAPAGRAATTPWGEIANFADHAGETSNPEQGFGVNPADGSAWVVDTVVEGEVERFRIQKFEQVSGTWKAVASRTFSTTEEEAHELQRRAEGVAFDPAKKRAYVLVTEEQEKGTNKGEEAAAELWAFSTTPNGSKIEAASETKAGVLVERTGETLTGGPIGKTKLAPQDTEKGMALLAPGGITVNPSNGEVLITGWDTKENNKEQPALWGISSGGTIEAAWEQTAKTKYPLEESFTECGCLNSPTVTGAGKVLALGASWQEIYEIPAALKPGESAKRAIWHPSSKAECEQLAKEKKEGKNVEACPFVEKLTEFESGSEEGAEMAAGPEGNLFVHVKVPDVNQEENRFGAVMVFNEHLEEIGWTGGGSSATETQACAVNETGLHGGGSAMVGGFEAKVFMFERGERNHEATKALELGAGGSTSGCPPATTTPLTASFNGTTHTSFPLSDKIVFSAKVKQANALSTEWDFGDGTKETIGTRQQETTLVEHKFTKEGKYKVVEKIHTDDLATPTIEANTEVTITGLPTITNEEAVVEGASATLKGEVNPNGQKASCEFQYGPAGEPFTGPGIKKELCPESPIEGKSPVPESIKVPIEAGKEYHFRIVATAGGEKVEGEERKYPQAAGGPEAETLAAGEVTATSATLNGKVNPKGVETASCKFEYGTTTSYGSTANCTPAPGKGTSPVSVSAKVTGLTSGTTYHFRIVDESSEHKTAAGADKELTTTVTAEKPVVEDLAATEVTQTAATLKATVNPKGSEVTECKFEYGTTTAYGTTAACPTPPGKGTSAVAESLPVSGLTAGTTYHFRVVAKNGLGTGEGSDKELKTLAKVPPVAETLPAEGVSDSGATLAGKVNPKGEATTCKFLYGETTGYGKEAPCSSQPGSGSTAVPVSAAITGLSANTTYHFKLVAESGGGTSEGADKELKTLEAPTKPAVETLAATGLTQTGATLKATVNPKGSQVTECEFEYGTTTAYGTKVACPTAPGSGRANVEESLAVSGLSPKAKYHYRVVATNAIGTGEGPDRELTTLAPPPPAAETGTVESVGETSVKLTGKANPEGEATTCKFLYGETTSYGKEAACSSQPGSGSTPVAVSATLSGLAANTVYHYKLLAESAEGKGEGADAEFKTLEAPAKPVAETLAAGGVTQTGATLKGAVNPKASKVTECEFEYGTTTAYGSKVACPLEAGEGRAAVEESVAVGGLAAGTTYHYRIVAKNGLGTGEGADIQFTTASEPVNPPPCTTCGGGGGGSGGVSPGHETKPVPVVTLSGAAAMVQPNGGFSLKLSCPGEETQCAGTVALKTLTAVAARSASSAKAKKTILTLASGSFTIAGGKLKAVSLHLTAKAKKLLAKMHTIRARVTVVAHDPRGTTHTTTAIVMLRAAKKKH